MILGKNLIVSIDRTRVAAAKSCTISVSQEFIQVCAPTERRVLSKIPTTYDWSMSVNGLVASSTEPNNLMDLLLAGTRVMLTFTDGSNQKRAGYAYVASCEESGSIGSLTTFSVQFESDGPLYKYTTSTVAAFTEGIDHGFTVNDSQVTYNNDRHFKICGASLVVSQPIILMLQSDNPYVIYNAPFSDIKDHLILDTMSELDSLILGAGQVDELWLNLSSGTYTILESVDYEMDPELQIVQFKEVE
jgi:hypothetical protein